MKDHLRFACAYWHSFTGSGADPFGGPRIYFHGMKKRMRVERAKDKMDAAFEFITKMSLPYYCFHDVDVVDYGDDVKENDKRLQCLVGIRQRKANGQRCKIVVGTANLFSHRPVHEWRCY
jgi:xylose isomerase